MVCSAIDVSLWTQNLCTILNHIKWRQIPVLPSCGVMGCLDEVMKMALHCNEVCNNNNKYNLSTS